jgi:NADH-quinone oxidoreductase subunit A
MLADAQSVVSYFAVLGMIILALVIVGALLAINKILGQRPQEKSPKKSDMYECGVDYVGTGQQQFSVRYYLIAIIFLLFDVEIVFMYPWTLAYKSYLHQGPFIIYEVAFFMLVLFGGYVYLRLRGAFNWD